MEDATRLPNVGARSRFYFPITDARPDGTFDDVGQLVFIAVDMGIDEDAWLHGMLNDRKTAACQFAAHLEVDSQAAEIDEGPATRSHVHIVTVHQRTVLPIATSTSRIADTILEQPRPVEVHYAGAWYRGDLTATRYEPDTGWWGMARFIVGVGMMHWHWKHESELGRR